MVSREVRIAKRKIIRDFPNLNFSDFEITSPETSMYNCLAYAAGDSSRRWDPNFFYWPADVPREMSVAAFQLVFQSLGYELTENDELEQGFSKIAIFVKDDKPRHAAKQLPDGAWSSKLGDGHDISHELRDLEGDFYGYAQIIMRKPI